MRGVPMQAGKRYKVAGWAPVAEGAAGEPVWDVVARYLRSKRIVAAHRVNRPKVLGVKDNQRISPP
jgi:sulfur-oxidizing protein SoxB